MKKLTPEQWSSKRGQARTPLAGVDLGDTVVDRPGYHTGWFVRCKAAGHEFVGRRETILRRMKTGEPLACRLCEEENA